MTRDEALARALDWAEGRRSWCNLGPHEPYTPDVIAVMDAQEVVKWSALAAALPAVDAAGEKIIRDGYKQFASRIALEPERRRLLLAKLHEEVAEVESSETETDFVAELGDLVEVCFALGGYEAVEDARNSKLEDRGGFKEGFVMPLAPASRPAADTPKEQA